MHYFLEKDGQGWKADRANMLKSLKEARSQFGRDIVCLIAKEHRVYWMSADSAQHFEQVLTDEGIEIISRQTGDEIATAHAKQPTRFSEDDKTRVSHPKLGEGVIINGEGTGKVVVQFASQKKLTRVAESALTKLTN